MQRMPEDYPILAWSHVHFLLGNSERARFHEWLLDRRLHPGSPYLSVTHIEEKTRLLVALTLGEDVLRYTASLPHGIASAPSVQIVAEHSSEEARPLMTWFQTHQFCTGPRLRLLELTPYKVSWSIVCAQRHQSPIVLWDSNIPLTQKLIPKKSWHEHILDLD